MLTFEKKIIKSARLGEASIIPDIHSVDKDPYFITEESVTKADNLAIGEGMIKTMLPYKTQNRYTHELYDTEYIVAVLENEYLKAVFLPELGGRLWSLYDKKKQRDLVYENDGIRFGNLAIRNAWFAGGVEWNIGMKGHSPLTCEPLFTQKVITENGEEALKMYAYEEIRGVVYSIIALLRKDELLVKINIENPNDHKVYMYWWSNIAADQTENTRVFVPANTTFVTGYRDGGYRISKKSIPMIGDRDVSYPKNALDAVDYFYNVPASSKKWIASVEKDGKGLLQFSDARLIGRKLFLWGNIPGGRHWNEWLTGGRDYLEIQAGLRKTQFEHFYMPAKSEITWCEVYKAVDVSDMNGDYFETVNQIDQLVYDPTPLFALFNHKPSEEIALYGTSHGALFEALNGKKLSESCVFPKDSITDEYAYYLDLLHGKTGKEYKIAYVKDERWAKLIEKRENKTALDYYLLGVNNYINEQYEKTAENFEKSIQCGPTYYALISLALLKAHKEKKIGEAVLLAKDAISLEKSSVALAHTFGELCITAGEPQLFIDYVDSAIDEIKNDGRIKMYYGNCLIMQDKLEKAKEYINKHLVIPDIREGEYSIANIWIELYRREMAKNNGKKPSEITDVEVLEAYPLPYEIDFRQH